MGLLFRHADQEVKLESFSCKLQFYMEEAPNIPERLSALAAGVTVCSKEEDEVCEILQKYCTLLGDSSGVESHHDDLMFELDSLCASN